MWFKGTSWWGRHGSWSHDTHRQETEGASAQPTFFFGFSPRPPLVGWWCPSLINLVRKPLRPRICSCQILDLFKWMITTTFCPPSLQNHELNKPLFFINHLVSSVLLQLPEQTQANTPRGLPHRCKDCLSLTSFPGSAVFPVLTAGHSPQP